jgi:hypothetical protein
VSIADEKTTTPPPPAVPVSESIPRQPVAHQVKIAIATKSDVRVDAELVTRISLSHMLPFLTWLKQSAERLLATPGWTDQIAETSRHLEIKMDAAYRRGQVDNHVGRKRIQALLLTNGWWPRKRPPKGQSGE